MAKYACIIDVYLQFDEDNEDEFPSSVGTCGPSRAPESLLERLRTSGDGQVFRMLFDESDVCYVGRFLSTSASTDLGCEAFGPLDDFGGPNIGCTMIEYLQDGEWVEL